MSFILDALKKSENDRQRQSGPALFEVRVPPPRSKLPMLAVIIVSLLVVNLGVVGWLMLRKPADAAVPPPPAAANAPGATPAPVPFNAQQNPPQQPPQGYAQQYPQQPGMQQPPPNMPPQGYNGAPSNGPANGYGYAQNGPNNSYGQSGANNGYAPSGANTGYPQPNNYGRGPNQEPVLDQSAAPAADSEQTNPDDYAPARDAPPPGTGAGRVVRGTVSGLPTYEEAATQTSIPPLHMDLHSYAADPSKRFVLINMRRLYEGQSLPEGPKVESINNDSAIISYNGTKFVLNKD
jgi:general secretion pathway protein B